MCVIVSEPSKNDKQYKCLVSGPIIIYKYRFCRKKNFYIQMEKSSTRLFSRVSNFWDS